MTSWSSDIPEKLPACFSIQPEIAKALRLQQPIVALESAVITHGLPHPQNLALAHELEAIVRREGAQPATIALLEGKICIGLTPPQLEVLAEAEPPPHKISLRDFGIALSRAEKGGTTVAATLFAAHQAGIQVFATGGIGGVHRGNPQDVSADLQQLARTPLIVVCAGAKAILDLPATVEYLETAGVPIIGFQTTEFPAFYARQSGLPVNMTADQPAEIAQIARAHWQAGLSSAVLVVAPPPAEYALPWSEVNAHIEAAIDEAQRQKIQGAALTPFLLDQLVKKSKGASLTANLALLHHNARLAAQIAKELKSDQRTARA
ncbi:MAG: pseudouridine-5'-phosphate glycosidase [Chloroflexi bacterium]|nr:pseudouridine-5'-phosphate glycosidase [Chloroflexota bacterium]